MVSFRAVAGSLTEKNNPLADGTGLYALPENTHLLGKAPYMEYTVGLENIFNILRVDYVRRINYLDWVPHDMKQGFKVSIHITM